MKIGNILLKYNIIKKFASHKNTEEIQRKHNSCNISYEFYSTFQAIVEILSSLLMEKFLKSLHIYSRFSLFFLFENDYMTLWHWLIVRTHGGAVDIATLALSYYFYCRESFHLIELALLTLSFIFLPLRPTTFGGKGFHLRGSLIAQPPSDDLLVEILRGFPQPYSKYQEICAQLLVSPHYHLYHYPIEVTDMTLAATGHWVRTRRGVRSRATLT